MKKVVKWLIIVLIIILIIVFVINFYVKMSTKKQIIDGKDYSSLENIDCIIVLGAGIWGDKPSPMLEDRLLQAIDLYNNNVSAKIIMSGDHGKEDYDEVNTMKDFAIQKGIPSEDIFMDHAGFSSYDSVYRAKEIFGAKKIIIVTQKYHLYRALYIANKLGIEAYGVGADPRQYVGATYREIREILARNKDFVKCIFKPKPTYLGDTIPVNGDGNITNDKEKQSNELIENNENASGSIVEIGDNYIIVQNENKKYKVNANDETNEFVNGRTKESIGISDIKIGDYYISKSIIRNISGDEWKKECLKNLANCYTEGNLMCNPQSITNVENKGDYVIITLNMEDSATEYFKGKNNIDSFELKAIAYSSLDIPTVSGGVTVYNIKEETEYFMFWIGLDKNTIDNEYPVINNIEIYDK